MATPISEPSNSIAGASAPPREGSTSAAHAERTCVACRKPAGRAELLRFVLGPEGELLADLAGHAPGRGAWVHPSLDCLKKGIAQVERSLKQPLKTRLEEVLVQIRASANRRALSLVGAARRAKALSLGADASQEAWMSGRAELVVIATDARSAKSAAWVEEARAAGIVVIWSDKSELGAALGRDSVGILVLTEPGLAKSLVSAVSLTQLALPSSRASECAKVTEVG